MKNFTDIIKNRILKANSGKFPDSLYRAGDLKSIREFVEPHGRALKAGRSLKGQFTEDEETLSIAKKIINKNKFLERQLLLSPSLESNKFKSIKVTISDIGDFPQYQEIRRKNKGREVMVCVGGPAAEEQSIMAGVISEIHQKLDRIIFITRNYSESNASQSASQSNTRSGAALNSDRGNTGHVLLPALMMRKLLGVTPEEALDPSYNKTDLVFTIDPAKLKIYFANELNWLRQEYKKRHDQLTEHEINRMEALLSQEILKAMEKISGCRLSTGEGREGDDSATLHVSLSSGNAKSAENRNAQLAKLGIESKRLTAEEIEFFFGDNPEIVGAYKYFGDSLLNFNIHDLNRKRAKNQGVSWLEHHQIKQIILEKNDQGEAELVGLTTADGEYIYASKLHFTGGYMVDYEYDKDSKSRSEGLSLRSWVNKIEDALNIEKPLNNEITTSTGVSGNFIFRKSPRLKKIIDKYGSTGELAIGHSHWSMIADNEDYIIMRVTGGGNTGSEEYPATYFLNVMANSRRIFGDDLIGIISTYGCPRAINSRNATEFSTIAHGAVISYGKGGIGNTKRFIEGAFGLCLNGFKKEVVEYFNQFQTRHGKDLGDNIDEIYQEFEKMNFFHDNVQKTSRRMGYDQSLSLEEIIGLTLFIAILSYGIKKGLVKESAEQAAAPDGKSSPLQSEKELCR